MNKGVAVVGASLVVAAAAVAIPRVLDDTPEQRTLVLSGSPCSASDPGALGNRKNKKIQWSITNNCTTAQDVQFRDFKRRHFDNSSAYDPPDNSIVDPYPPGTSSPIGASGGTGSVDTKVNKGPKWVVFTDTYKYDIYLRGPSEGWRQVLDPDVEIWPF